MNRHEERLQGGNTTSGVVRIGDTVRRPAGPHTPAVHAFLEHLHDAGSRRAPRPLGIDDQWREVLSYVPGSSVHPDRLHLLDLLPRRTRAMYDPARPRRRHETEPWARLWHEDHGKTWGANTDYIADNAQRWRIALLDE